MGDTSTTATTKYQSDLLVAQPSGDTGKVVHVCWSACTNWSQTSVLLDPGTDLLPKVLERCDGRWVVYGGSGLVGGYNTGQLDVMMRV
jgi:hypothetical protein